MNGLQIHQHNGDHDQHRDPTVDGCHFKVLFAGFRQVAKANQDHQHEEDRALDCGVHAEITPQQRHKNEHTPVRVIEELF